MSLGPAPRAQKRNVSLRIRPSGPELDARHEPDVARPPARPRSEGRTRDSSVPAVVSVTPASQGKREKSRKTAATSLLSRTRATSAVSGVFSRRRSGSARAVQARPRPVQYAAPVVGQRLPAEGIERRRQRGRCDRAARPARAPGVVERRGRGARRARPRRRAARPRPRRARRGPARRRAARSPSRISSRIGVDDEHEVPRVPGAVERRQHARAVARPEVHEDVDRHAEQRTARSGRKREPREQDAQRAGQRQREQRRAQQRMGEAAMVLEVGRGALEPGQDVDVGKVGGERQRQRRAAARARPGRPGPAPGR